MKLLSPSCELFNFVKENRKRKGEKAAKSGEKAYVFYIFLPPGRVGWIRVKNEEVQLGKNMIFQRGVGGNRKILENIHPALSIPVFV